MTQASTAMPLREDRGNDWLHMLLTSVTALRVGVIVILLVLWEISARLWGNPMFIAPPSEVAISFVRLLGDGQLLSAVGRVFVSCLIAFALSVAVGTALGLVVGLNGFMRDAFFPIVLLLYATPQSPFLPLMTIAFGSGIEAKVAYGFTHGVFPIMVTVISGVERIDRRLMLAARSMGAGRLQMLSSVVFPSVMASLFTGMRLAMAAVILGVLLAELYVSTGGIGFFTKMFSNRFEPENLLALIAMLAIIAVTLNETCRRAERYYSAWREG
jgi:NitT/TauT family transport system permease protein